MLHIHPQWLLSVCLLLRGAIASAQENDEVLLWSSTGGGWRAMFADVGFANVFRKAGLMTRNSTRFSGVATVSGSSWFSTQLFYSPEFYNRTVLADTPEELEDFVIRWMETYYNISSDVDEETEAACDTSGLKSSKYYDPERDFVSVWYDICVVVVKFDFDWAFFIQEMLDAAATDYGDASFIHRLARPENRIAPMANTDLLIQASLAPNSRVRQSSNAVYLGHTADQAEKLFTVPLSAAWVVEDYGAQWWYGTQDRTSQLRTYVAKTPVAYSWDHWEPFFLYPGNAGAIEIDNTQDTIGATLNGVFRHPFGGAHVATVVQVAASSSAAGANASPLVPSFYSQVFSIPHYGINQAKVNTVWRVLLGIVAGIGTGLITGFLVRYLNECWNCFKEGTSKKLAIATGVFCGIGFGLLTAIVYGTGSILVPKAYDIGVDRIYQNPNFDNFAVCSQWPNSCGEQDGFLLDGWFVDNPALAINIAHHQRRDKVPTDKPLKAILTNNNEEWNTTFNRAQILQYFATYFNKDVPPAEFLWAPGYWAPYRSPQIFSEYIDEAGLDSLLESIPGSNMTTAILKGTTVNNPSFGVVAGQTVEVLLLNLNENITTDVLGKQLIEKFTIPLAKMTSHIASNQVLLQRVSDFVAA